MSIVAQLFVVFFVYLASEGIAALLPFTFPASVMGMVILLVLLLTKVLKPAQLKESSDFLLGNMLLFFIPTCVSVITYADVLFRNFWSIVLISVLTTPLVFFVTGQVVQLTMKRIRKKGEKEHA
jgi:holin-like protein